MRKFMIIASSAILWWLCGVATMGFNNAYNQYMYCEKDGKRSDRYTINMENTFSVLSGPIGLIVSLPTSGFGRYGFNFDLGCPRKE